jgi:hypothetical protein
LRLPFDHNVDRRFRTHLLGHEIQTTRQNGWDKLENGALLKAAADAGFEAFLRVDKKLEHEQNLGALPIAVIVIDSVSNALPALLPFAPSILDLLKSPLRRMLHIVQPDGTVLRLTAPRP